MLENVVVLLVFRFKLKNLRQGELGQPQQQDQTNQVKTIYRKGFVVRLLHTYKSGCSQS